MAPMVTVALLQSEQSRARKLSTQQMAVCSSITFKKAYAVTAGCRKTHLFVIGHSEKIQGAVDGPPHVHRAVADNKISQYACTSLQQVEVQVEQMNTEQLADRLMASPSVQEPRPVPCEGEFKTQ